MHDERTKGPALPAGGSWQVGHFFSSDAGPSGLALDRRQTGLLVVDWQERLAGAMPAEAHESALRHAVLLVETAQRLGLPVVVSEQYPKGLGRTVAPLAEAIARVPADRVARFEKLAFSCGATAEFRAIRERIGRPVWVVCGMETHVCVYQTARDLVAAGLGVQVPADAVVSRAKANWRAGLELARAAGAVVTATEVVVFDLLGGAGDPAFKEISRRVR